MADFVRDHVGLGEIARRAEPPRQLVEEGGVEIELAVGGAVVRSGRRRGAAARRSRRAVEQHEPRRLVTRAHRLEHGLPHVLGVAEHGGDEVLPRVLRRVGDAGRRRPRRALWPVSRRRPGVRGGRRRAAFERADHLQRIDAEDQARDHDHDERAAAQPDAAAAGESASGTGAGIGTGPIVDVVAPPKVTPAHRVDLLVRPSRYGFSAR